MDGQHMETLSDLALVDNIKNKKNEEESLKELINRHSGIYLNMVHSFMKNANNPSLKEDVIAEKDYIIYSSALKYDEKKGAKFSTHVGNEAKWACLNAANKNKKYVELFDNQFDLTEIEHNSLEESHHFNSNVVNTFIEYAESCSDKRIAKIFKLRYSSDKKLTPWRKISKEMNLSIQGCINIHNNALNILSKKVKSKYEINY